MKSLLVLLTLITCVVSSCSHNKRTMEKRNFKFYTEYGQFYIQDKESTGNSGSPNFWTDKAFIERLALEDGLIGVGTQSWGNIKGEIEILKSPNNNSDFSRYDHIVEGGINIKSGVLQILNCPDYNLEVSIKLEPGKYRARVYSSNLASVKESDLANDTDDDYYRIEIWPSDDMERKVLKQYTE